MAGGSLELDVHNSGLAPSFQGYVEVTRVAFRVRPPAGRGLFVFQQRPDGPSFWRRGRAGDMLTPDTRVAAPRSPTPGAGVTLGEADMVFPETLISGDPGERLSKVLARAWTGALAPRSATTVQVTVTGDLPDQQTGTWSWCLVARCFDLLQEPPAGIVLPTPLQPEHHTRILCLHDTLD